MPSDRPAKHRKSRLMEAPPSYAEPARSWLGTEREAPPEQEPTHLPPGIRPQRQEPGQYARMEEPPLTPDRSGPPPSPPYLRTVTESLTALRREVGRLRRRLNTLEFQARVHTHDGTSPPARNGVHIDSAGRYWMRRPDGWHPMHVVIPADIGKEPVNITVPASPAFPVRRLVEPPKSEA